MNINVLDILVRVFCGWVFDLWMELFEILVWIFYSLLMKFFIWFINFVVGLILKVNWNRRGCYYVIIVRVIIFWELVYCLIL